MSEPGTVTPQRRSRSRTVKIVQVTITVVIMVAFFAFFIPSVADYSEVWATIRGLTLFETLSLVGVTILNILTYWIQMVSFMPRLTLGQAAVNNQTSTSVANTVPGGGAIAVGISYAMFRSWGFTDSEIVLFTLNSGVWNAFMKLGLPVIAVALIAITGEGTTADLVPALIGLAILLGSIAAFALLLWKKSFAYAIGTRLGTVMNRIRSLARKPRVNDWGDRAVRFRKQTNTLVADRWPAMLVSTIVSHLTLYFVLLLTLRHVGVSQEEVTWAQALGVFALSRLASAVPLMPGGVGVVEAVQIAGLVLVGGNHAQVVAAVLVFRLLTYGVQIPLGAITYFVWQRNKSWRKHPDTAIAPTT
jgi:putative heme transporter